MKDHLRSTPVVLGYIDKKGTSLERKRRVSYDIRPSGRMASTHVETNKPYCDILGRKYCIVCSEETMRETAYVQSLTEAENVISRSANQSRMSYTTQSWQRSDYGIDMKRESCFQEDGRVDHLVNSMFPLMYRALSSTTKVSNAGSVRPTSDRGKIIRSFESNSQRHEIRTHTPACSLDSTIDYDDFEANSDFISVSEKNNFPSEEGTLNDQAKLCTRSTLIGEELGYSGERDLNSSETDQDHDTIDDLETLSISSDVHTGVRQKKSGRSYHELVRRSSVVGKGIRNQTNEKIRFRLKEWKPTKYLQFRVEREEKYIDSGLGTLEETASENKKSETLEPILTLEKLKLPKYTQSMLPMEPVMCGFKYIKNRWKDEAVFKNNDFAIKLNMIGKDH
eukprot:gene6399-11840_t